MAKTTTLTVSIELTPEQLEALETMIADRNDGELDPDGPQHTTEGWLTAAATSASAAVLRELDRWASEHFVSAATQAAIEDPRKRADLVEMVGQSYVDELTRRLAGRAENAERNAMGRRRLAAIRADEKDAAAAQINVTDNTAAPAAARANQ